MKKKFLSVLLSLAMLLTLLPTTALAGATEHTHDYTNGLCSCGAHNGEHTGWTNWGDDDNEKTSLPTEAGNYYLSDDVKLNENENWKIDTSKTVTLCLNGHVLDLSGNQILVYDDDSTLNLYDCGSDTHKFTVGADGLWTLDEANGTETVTGGVITGGSAESGGAVCNYGTFNMYGGAIVGNKAVTNELGHKGYGGGVYNNGVTFNMYDGVIVGNTAEWGGGVDCYEGAFNMYGGAIVGNRATKDGDYYGGGGVYVDAYATFTMENGTITGNTAPNGGGVYVYYNTFTMTGGEVTGNTASDGGGVYVGEGANFAMSDTAEIVGNTATYGGGVYVYYYNTFNMTGGTISGNEATLGGGVYVGGVYVGGVYYAGTFYMNGDDTEITGNEATYGGGVYVDSYGSAKLSGGKITKNVAVYNAGSNGGGVYVDGTVIVGGSVQITDNLLETKWDDKTCEYTTEANNLYLPEGQTVQLGTGIGDDEGENGVAVPAEDMQVGVTMSVKPTSEASAVTFTEEDTPAATTDVAYFFSDDTTYYVKHETSVLQLKAVGENTVLNVTQGTVYTDLTTAIGEANDSGDTLKLLDNVTINATLEISKTLTLDLNGHVLRGYKTESDFAGSVIKIGSSGDLTLEDSDPTAPHDKLPAGGVITGGNAEVRGGGVCVGVSTNFTMNGGSIFGNTAPSGGGVSVESSGSFTMNGGSIVGNTTTGSSSAGGGVYASGCTFNMTGGEIAGNSANYGGGVYASSCAFTMTGGEITRNTATTNGGGVYVDSNNVTLGGTAKITGNFKGTNENNLYLTSSKTVTISTTNAPAPGMVVGVTTQTAPSGGSNIAITAAAGGGAAKYFTSDNAAYTAVNPQSNYVALIAVDNTESVINVSKNKPFANLSEALTDAADNNQCIRLLADIEDNITIDRNITLDLNGHVLKGSGSGSVITVSSGKTLTLIDTNPTAKHTDDYETLPAGGCITGGANCGVNVKNGTFNMYGGNIVGNSASNGGGGVYVYDANGKFTMSGGAICKNTAMGWMGTTYGGGGVKVDGGSFTMTGGVISDNTASGTTGYDGMGGGVTIFRGSFTMTGGSITGNTATNGGGVYMYGGTLTLGGTAKITGNFKGTDKDDLYLPDGKTVAISTTTPPADGFSVGVANPVPTENDPPVVFTSNALAAEKYGFFSNQGHQVIFAPDRLELAYIERDESSAPPAPSGGSSSSTYTVPVSGDKTSVKVQATISGSNATIKNVTSAEIETVGTGDNVVVDLSGVNKSVTAVTIPKTTFDNVAASEASGLEVKFPDGTVAVFDSTTVAAVSEQAAGSNIQLVVDQKNKAEQALNAAQKATVKELNNALVIDAYFVSSGKRISDFKGGSADLTVSYPTTKPVRVWYLAEDGTKTLVPSSYDGKTATFTVTHFSHYVIEILDGSSYAACPQDNTCVYAKFTDANTAAWYHDGVHYCVENGYMSGFPGDIFKPNGTLSRAMIVTILWNMEGKPTVNYAMSFKDVAAGEWYTEAIRWAQSTKVVEGYSGDAFGPNDNVTREQLAAILMRYAAFKGIDVTARADLAKFTDAASISAWALENVKWANAVGIVSGRTTTTIVPTGTATRAEAANMVQRFCETVLEK